MTQVEDKEKWIVNGSFGREEVWTMKKVNDKMRSGKSTAKGSFILAVIVFILWFSLSYDANASMDEIQSHYDSPLLWVVAFFIIIALFGAEGYFSAKHAKEIYEVKKEKH